MRASSAMREISQHLYETLGRSLDWKSVLEGRLGELKAAMGDASCAADAFEVAQTFEHCVADRDGAVAAYILCYRADPKRLDALKRARQISAERGDFATLARLCHLQHKQGANPQMLVEEGIAWLDADEPDRAIKPLLMAAEGLPHSPALASALCTARREWPNVRAEIDRLREAVNTAPSDESAADFLVQAARTLRMLGTDDAAVERCLLAAFQRDPENLSALGMLEARLANLSNQDAFMRTCEQRLSARKTAASLVDELRRMGLQHSASPLFHSMGVRLLHRSIRTAYQHELSEIPGHLAMLGLLREYCQESRLLAPFLEMVDAGLALPLPKIDLLFLALQGLDLSWRILDDTQSAATYAALARRLAPEHPLVIAAAKEGLVADIADDALLNVTDSPSYLDELNLAAPSLQLGPRVGVREQFAAAAHSVAADAEPVEAEPVVEAPVPSAPEPVEASPPPAAAPPPSEKANALGRISLIPASAIAALKKSSTQRNTIPRVVTQRAPRLNIPLTVEFVVGGAERRLVTRDLSATGACFVTDFLLRIEQVLDVSFLMPLGTDSLRTEAVSLVVKVVRAMPGGYGVVFLEVPAAFHVHLQRLLDRE